MSNFAQLSRCWPDLNVPSDAFDDVTNQALNCGPSSDPADVTEGRKSFPSGHSSFAFATFGFCFLYLSGKMQTFAANHKRTRRENDSARLVASVFLIVVPTLIAASRTCDYHHHWQDVTVGSILGMVLSYVIYRHYYPPLTSPNCSLPNSALPPILSTMSRYKSHGSVKAGGDSDDIIDEMDSVSVLQTPNTSATAPLSGADSSISPTVRHY